MEQNLDNFMETVFLEGLVSRDYVLPRLWSQIRCRMIIWGTDSMPEDKLGTCLGSAASL